MPTRVTGNVIAVDMTTDNSNTTIAVPAAADGAVIFWNNYSSQAGQEPDTLTINGVSALAAESVLGDGDVNDAAGVGVAVLDGVATGNQTFAWSWGPAGNIADGGFAFLAFYENTGGGTSVRASYTEHQSSTAISQAVSTETDDLLLVMACAYSASAATCQTANATLISDNPHETAGFDIETRVYDVTPLATSTTILQNVQSFGGIAVVSLQEVAASGGVVTSLAGAGGLVSYGGIAGKGGGLAG